MRPGRRSLGERDVYFRLDRCRLRGHRHGRHHYVQRGHRRLAPDFSGIDVLPGSLWPANGRLHLFRLGQEISPTVVDTCDSSPSVRIVDASGDGDISYGDEAICVRAAAIGSPNPLRRYTVTVEAVDASGNWSQQDVLISNAALAPAVADNDPRCP